MSYFILFWKCFRVCVIASSIVSLIVFYVNISNIAHDIASDIGDILLMVWRTWGIIFHHSIYEVLDVCFNFMLLLEPVVSSTISKGDFEVWWRVLIFLQLNRLELDPSAKFFTSHGGLLNFSAMSRAWR